MAALRLVSTLTCPSCGFQEALAMPEDACVIRQACASCGAELRPKLGDCCVFCSYGDVPCPPRQNGACCSV
ncbi:MAG: GDCCVxC domain-containing (seleno)protein [Methylocystis sp.]